MNDEFLHRIRVLIADDEAVLREALSDLIADDLSMEFVGAAEDADQAIELASKARPDVAVLDVKMPRGGGPKAAREIRIVSPNTRVVALSAFGDRVAVVEMLKAGAVGYLLKGASVIEIKRAIHRAVEAGLSVDAEIAGRLIEELSGQLEREEREADEKRARIRRIKAVLHEGALKIALQPIFHLSGGGMVGMEALARFDTDPYQTPDIWFADAHAVGLGLDLELAAAARALENLGDLPPTTFLSINLSPDIAAAPDFARTLEGISGDRIVIEVTEHAPIADYRALSHAMDTLRANGVRLAIDDAGAGFASLKHILRLAPDFIKLDIALTRDIDTDRSRRSLAKALIAFASETAAIIVAEGIETQQELDVLKALGVDHGQGNYLGSVENIPSLPGGVT